MIEIGKNLAVVLSLFIIMIIVTSLVYIIYALTKHGISSGYQPQKPEWINKEKTTIKYKPPKGGTGEQKIK